MRRVLHERDYDLPVERLFDYLAEHEHYEVLFGTRIERVRDGEGGERNGVGSVRRLSFRGLLPFEETVTEYEPNRRIVYTVSKGTPLRNHRGELLFSERSGGGSHLRYEIVFDTATLVPGRVIAAALQRSVGQGLDKLPRYA